MNLAIERRKPIAVQVSNLLAQRIHVQEYLPGSRLPSESELALELGVSRATVRSALGRLAAEGLVIRKQGDGTYVNAHIEGVATRMGGLWNFLRLIENSGYQPTIRALAKRVRPATAAEATALRLEAGSEVLTMTRLFCADGTPAIVAYGVAPTSLLLLPPDECNAELPLSEFIQRYYERQIVYAIFDVSSALANDAIASALQLERSSPLLVLEQSFYDSSNQPLFYSRGYFRDKVIRLRLVQTWE